MTYGNDEYRKPYSTEGYRKSYNKEGQMKSQIKARNILHNRNTPWWWGPWHFVFDEIMFYLMLYRNDMPLSSNIPFKSYQASIYLFQVYILGCFK